VAEVPTDELDAARRLYDLALTFQERSQRTEARLLEQFEESVGPISPVIGEVIIVDDEDERLVLTNEGGLRAQVVPEDAEGEWRPLLSPDDLVEFYDPTDVFGDLADAVAEGWPDVAPEAVAIADDGAAEEQPEPVEPIEPVEPVEPAEEPEEGEADRRNGS
jgi:hypothetical protein